MGKYTVIAPFKDAQAKRVRGIGETLEADDERGQTLLSKRVVKELKQEPTTPAADDDGIVHVGGGYYQLPNGEKVKGKDQAFEALAALQASSGDGTPDGNTDGAEHDSNGDNSQEGAEQNAGS